MRPPFGNCDDSPIIEVTFRTTVAASSAAILEIIPELFVLAIIIESLRLAVDRFTAA